MKIYLDLFFLINVEMDLLLLMILYRIKRQPIRWKRILLSAVTGGLFSLFFLLSGVHRYPFLSFPFYLIGSGLIVRLAWGRTDWRTWIKNFIVFYAMAFLLSGLLVHIQNVFQKQGSVLFLMSVTILALSGIHHLLPWFEHIRIERSRIVPVQIFFQGHCLRTNALMDTGNRLRDPFSGEHVSVAERTLLEPYMNDREIVFRYIPFRTVGVNEGMLAAFRVERIEVQIDKENWIRILHPWLAVSETLVSAEGEYRVILHPELIHPTNQKRKT